MVLLEACNLYQLAVSRICRLWEVVVGLTETTAYRSGRCMQDFNNKQCTRHNCNHIYILQIHLLSIPRLIRRAIHLSLMVYQVIVSWAMLFPELLKANQQTEAMAIQIQVLLVMGTRSCIASRQMVFAHHRW